MDYWITAEPGYLRARLFERETVEETREFIRAVVRENREHRSPAIVLDIRSSRPIFHFEPDGFFEYFKKLWGDSPACRIALVGDTEELHLSHEYLELLARQQGWNVRSFRDAAAAHKWLADRREHDDRRHASNRRQVVDQRHVPEQRRHRMRRGSAENRPQVS
jgi:hypothetical protein